MDPLTWKIIAGDIYPIGRPLIGKWPEPSQEAHSCSDNKRLKRQIALSLTLNWPEWRGSFDQHATDKVLLEARLQ